MGLCICTQKLNNQLLDDSAEKQENYSRDIHKLNKKSRFSGKSQVGSQDSKDQEECKTTLSSSEIERASSRTVCSIRDIQRLRSISKETISLNMSEQMMTETERTKINKALKTHEVFSQFNEEILSQLIDRLKLYNLTAKSLLFECLAPSDEFYILSSGKLEVYGDNKTRTIIKPVSIIGENTNSVSNRREHAIKALEKCVLWRIDREEICDIIQNTNTINYIETKNFIDFHSVLCNLSPDKKLALSGCFYSRSFNPGTIFLEATNMIYFILYGSVTITLNPNLSTTLTRGDFFGEHGVSSSLESSVKLTATTDVTCLVILYSNFSNITANLISQLHTDRSLLTVIANSPTFNILTTHQQKALIKAFQVTRYYTNSVILPKNFQRNAKLMVILRGKCMWETNKVVVDTYSCIGNQDIIQEFSQSYHDSLVAQNVVEIAHMNKAEFEKAIGGSYSKVSLQNEAYRAICAISPFHYLHSSKLQKIAMRMRLRNFEHKQEIVKQGDAYHVLYIMHFGKADLISYENTVSSLYKDDCYGIMGLFQDENSKFSLVANGEVSCWVLNKEDFYSIVDSSRRNQLLDRLGYLNTEVTLEDLVLVKPLAKGMSGLVFLAAHKTKNLLYALKAYTHKMINVFRLYENILNEKNILRQLDHPMILKLVKTFKDEHRIYFLTEYIKGLDLFEVLHKMNRVDESGCKFYTAGLLIILQYVHERNIVFRDLKPENIMIDQDVRYIQGYPKLIDFGTAKVVTGRTYSTVGTPQYMAPEIIQGEGYGIEVDYWSLGIILYDLLCGNIPFGDLDDPIKIYDKILAEEIIYPRSLQASPAMEFTKLMLNINPKLRIQGSIENLPKHRMFNGFDWVRVIQDKFMLREMIAPFKPTIACLGMEIQDARRSTIKFNEFIARLENNETDKSRGNRTNVEESSDWDRDF